MPMADAWELLMLLPRKLWRCYHRNPVQILTLLPSLTSRQTTNSLAAAPKPRIINGMTVNTDRFPYFALKNQNAMCGAVLIGSRFVLTAAHCEGASERFILGARESDSSGIATVDWESFLVHPEYRSSDFDHDIMLYYLDRDFPDIPTIKLERNPVTVVGTPMSVIGFGDMRGNDSGRLFLSDELLETQVAYVDSETCAAAHAGDPITDDMLVRLGNSCIRFFFFKSWK